MSKKKGQARKGTKPGSSSNSAKYDVISELANAHLGITFGQLIRGDVFDAQKEMKCLLSARSGLKVNALNAGNKREDQGTRRLKVAELKFYGLTVLALPDSGAIPNVFSAVLVRKLSVIPKETTMSIKVATGDRYLWWVC